MRHHKGVRVYNVPCVNGVVHQIFVGRRGHMRLGHGHNVDAELAMFKMSGVRVSTCVLAMCRMRGWPFVLGLATAVFPPRLRNLFAEANQKRDQRRQKQGRKMTEEQAYFRLQIDKWDEEDWLWRKFAHRPHFYPVRPYSIFRRPPSD